MLFIQSAARPAHSTRTAPVKVRYQNNIKFPTLSQFKSPHRNSVKTTPHNAEFIYKIKSKSQWGCTFHCYCGHTKCSIDPYAFKGMPFDLKILNLQREMFSFLILFFSDPFFIHIDILNYILVTYIFYINIIDCHGISIPNSRFIKSGM